jgi:hypothetical protein
MITRLLQAVTRLAASCELQAGLMQVVSSTLRKSANIKLQQAMPLIEVNRLDTTCWHLATYTSGQ